MNLIKNLLISEVGPLVDAATGINNNSDRLDMTGYDGVLFIAGIAISANNGDATITVEQSDDDSDTDMIALTGATATGEDSGSGGSLDGQILLVEVYRPIKQWVQCVRSSANGDITFNNIIAIRYKGRKSPVVLDTSVAASALVASPSEV